MVGEHTDHVHVASDATARRAAAAAARAALRHTGALGWDDLVDDVTAHTGITLRGDRTNLAALLGVGGTQGSAWLVDRPAPTLRTALTAVAGAYEWVSLDDLSVGLARTRAGAEGNPPMAADRAGPAGVAADLPGWSVTWVDGAWRAVPVGQPPQLNHRDTAFRSLLVTAVVGAAAVAPAQAAY